MNLKVGTRYVTTCCKVIKLQNAFHCSYKFNTIPRIAENAEIILPVNDHTDWQSQNSMPLQSERIHIMENSTK